jgi:excisionase family DNA binding protein
MATAAVKDDVIMTPIEAAKYLGVEVQTLAAWRSRKSCNIPYFRLGTLIRYRKSDVDAFLDSQKVEVAS